MNILELLIILIVALVVFKPADLPKLANQLGKLLANGRKLFTHVELRIADEINTQRLQANIEKAKRAELNQQHD